MATDIIPIKALPGTMVSQASPTKNYASYTQFAVRNGGAGDIRILKSFKPPFPQGAKITYAHIKLYPVAAIPGTHTIRCSRITGAWNRLKVTWNTRPTTSIAEAVSVTKTGAAKNAAWDFNIQAMMQAVSDGATWQGFQFEETTADATGRYFYGAKGAAAYVPVIEISWALTPDAPEALTPSEGRVTGIPRPTFAWNFHDVVGNTEMTAYQLQTSATEAFSAVAWDSGERDSGVPQHTWESDLSVGFWWRVKNKDGDNVWGPYSEPVYYGGYVPKEPVVIDSPFGDTLSDISPVIAWTPGAPQKHYQVLMFAVRAGSEKIIDDSSKLTGVDTTETMSLLEPQQRTVVPLDKYIVEVRSWDEFDRATTPGDTAYSSARKEFNRVDDGSIDPVDSLVKVPDSDGRPWMPLRVSTANAPDAFRIRRDGVLLDESFTPEDTHQAGTNYLVIDRSADPRKDHVWEVLREENGKLSAGNPSTPGKIVPATAWLCSSDGRYAFPFVNYDASGLALGENSAQFFPLNSDEGWTVYQGQRGFSGGFFGVISGELGSDDADEYIKKFLQMRAETGLKMQLSYANLNLTGTINQATFSPTVFQEEVVNGVNFTFTQKGQLV